MQQADFCFHRKEEIFRGIHDEQDLAGYFEFSPVPGLGVDRYLLGADDEVLFEEGVGYFGSLFGIFAGQVELDVLAHISSLLLVVFVDDLTLSGGFTIGLALILVSLDFFGGAFGTGLAFIHGRTDLLHSLR
jgi:hypothetical protein